jgi:N-acyl-D-aspartate/D-glutamate deacylase
MFDLVVRGGDVIDGTGEPRRRADVGVRDGRVVAVGDLVAEHADSSIDAEGLVVAPGFVDLHTHYDAQLLWDPAATPSPFHGVTTVVGGNCGFTIAPLEPGEVSYVQRMLARVEGMPLESLQDGPPWDWRSFGEYLARLDGNTAVNAGFLVGHSALRRVAMGERSGDAATDDDVAAMVRLLHESLTAGGLGFSSSQAGTHNDYEGNPVPSRASSRDELLALCTAAGEHEGTTLEFIPVVGPFTDEHVDLMAAMSRAANRPLNWNLLAPTSATVDAYKAQLAASDHAAANGGRVLALTVPEPVQLRLSLASGFLLEMLPDWRDTMSLPLPQRCAALGDSAIRARLREGAAKPEAGMFSFLTHWERLVVAETFHPDNAGLSGRTLGEIAAERGQDAFEALCDIAVLDDLRTGLLPPMGATDDASWTHRRDVWRDGRAVIGASDAGAHLDMLSTFTYTTTVLGEAVRERNLLPLEEAVHYLTDVPARLYGIRDRGRIADGWFADLVVFDPATVRPHVVRTRYDLPGGAGRLYAEADGIEHVVVNGVPITRSGALTGDTPGTVLRSGRDTVTVTARS